MRCCFQALSEDRKSRGRFLRFEHEHMSSSLFRPPADCASVAVEGEYRWPSRLGAFSSTRFDGVP